MEYRWLNLDFFYDAFMIRSDFISFYDLLYISTLWVEKEKRSLGKQIKSRVIGIMGSKVYLLWPVSEADGWIFSKLPITFMQQSGVERGS